MQACHIAAMPAAASRGVLPTCTPAGPAFRPALVPGPARKRNGLRRGLTVQASAGPFNVVTGALAGKLPAAIAAVLNTLAIIEGDSTDVTETVTSLVTASSAATGGVSAEQLTAKAAAAISSLPQEALYGGAAAAVLGLGITLFGVAQAAESVRTLRVKVPEAGANELPRKNAVLVVGAAGRVGSLVVKELLVAGRTVVAAVRSADKAAERYAELGITAGLQDSGVGILFIEGGVDVTKAQTLSPAVFRGVSQVVSVLGPQYGTLPDGTRGFIDNMTPERVDAQGVKTLMQAAQEALPKPEKRTVSPPLLSFASEEDIGLWQRLDDVIMGGQSSSTLALGEGHAMWSGELVVEGGGFCGQRCQAVELDLSMYDGLALRVKGDGQTYKINVKTGAQLDVPEDTYQARFETAAGDWQTVFLPWHAFVATKKAKVDPQGKPLDPSQVRQFGLVLSRFEFNSFPNDAYRPGPFEMCIESIGAYKDPVPQIVLVSSAGVERNAIVGDDAEARKAEIPIVQLNPGGILNYKYDGEVAVRTSGLSYCVVRPTGLTDEPEGPALLEAGQGDRMSGLVRRDEVAAVVARVLATPLAAARTFELRRGTGPETAGKAMGEADYQRMLLGTVADTRRPAVGLAPFPVPVAYTPPPPPPPPAPEPTPAPAAVVEPAASAAPAAAAPTPTQPAAADWIAAWKKRSAATATAPAAEQLAEPANAAGASDARAWIAAWKERSAAAAPAHAPAATGDEASDEVASARAWILAYKARTLEAQLPSDVEAGSDVEA